MLKKTGAKILQFYLGEIVSLSDWNLIRIVLAVITNSMGGGGLSEVPLFFKLIN
jgi:hypothetical protein